MGAALNSGRRVQLQDAFRIALSIVLTYWLAMALNWPSPKNGAIAIAVTSLATIGASFNKGLARILGTGLGAIAGLAILAVFAQMRWGFMLSMALLVVVASYAMQKSRNGYAWLLGALTAIVIWASSYLKVETAFRVSLFRFVETAGGVAIYTAVSLAFWPRRSGRQLFEAGETFLGGLRDYFRHLRLALAGQPLPAEAAKLRASLAGSLPPFGTTLEAALVDTPSVRARGAAFEQLPANLEALGNALSLWHQGVEDATDLELDRLLPGLEAELERVERRLVRGADLWAGREEAAPDDVLLSPLGLEIRHTDSLSHSQRARLMVLAHQSQVVDETSRALLRTLRAAAGLAPIEEPETPAVPTERVSRWDPERLLTSLFPGLCFVACFLLWIFTNPPAGNSIPILGAVFGMLLMQTPMNLFKIGKLLLLGIVIISPLYMFLLPKLETGAALLAVAFVTTFLIGLLGGKLAPLRSLGLLSFALITNITNRQSYSFFGVLYPAIMIFLGTCTVMATYWFLSPMRPEKIALRSVRRFFGGCARIVRGFAGRQPTQRAMRKHSFRSLVRPAMQRLRTAQQSLDYQLFPDNTPEKVAQLAGALQSIVYRLQALDQAYDRLRGDVEFAPGGRLRESLVRVYERWARSPEVPALDEERAQLTELSQELRGELDRLVDTDEVLLEFWAVMGCVQGLLVATKDAQDAMQEVRWDQWALPRF